MSPVAPFVFAGVLAGAFVLVVLVLALNVRILGRDGADWRATREAINDRDAGALIEALGDDPEDASLKAAVEAALSSMPPGTGVQSFQVTRGEPSGDLRVDRLVLELMESGASNRTVSFDVINTREAGAWLTQAILPAAQ
jgi:hypothetical protein